MSYKILLLTYALFIIALSFHSLVRSSIVHDDGNKRVEYPERDARDSHQPPWYDINVISDGGNDEPVMTNDRFHTSINSSNRLKRRKQVARQNFNDDIIEDFIPKIKLVNKRQSKLLSRNICETKKTNLLVSKQEFDINTGKLIRFCQGRVSLNWCDGECLSYSRPSIASTVGFKQSCFCCAEGKFKKTQIKLNVCKDSNGFLIGQSENFVSNSRNEMESLEYLPGEDKNKFDYQSTNTSMLVTIDEPIDCRCKACKY